MSELRALKRGLTAALSAVAKNVSENVSLYALVDTEDPGYPFELRWVQRPGATSRESSLINERLFETAFLDYGFREVRDENNIEGIVYKDIEDKFADPDCIGVAGFDFFSGSERVRMAHGIEAEGEEENQDAFRFALFLKMVEGSVVDGEPAQELDYEDVTKVLGLVFKYDITMPDGSRDVVVAFQRIQRMWVQQKSSFLLFSRDGQQEFFSDRSLKLGNNFDFVLFQQHCLFRSLKTLEGLFCFRRLMQQHARDYVEVLDHLVADYEKLEERINESPTVVNKLLKIQKAESPVVDMPSEEVEHRVKRISYYSGKVNFNEQGKVMLITNANVNNFLRMLGDDLLVSPLTDVRYETKSKKRLDDPADLGE